MGMSQKLGDVAISNSITLFSLGFLLLFSFPSVVRKTHLTLQEFLISPLAWQNPQILYRRQAAISKPSANYPSWYQTEEGLSYMYVIHTSGIVVQKKCFAMKQKIV